MADFCALCYPIMFPPREDGLNDLAITEAPKGEDIDEESWEKAVADPEHHVHSAICEGCGWFAFDLTGHPVKWDEEREMYRRAKTQHGKTNIESDVQFVES